MYWVAYVINSLPQNDRILHCYQSRIQMLAGLIPTGGSEGGSACLLVLLVVSNPWCSLACRRITAASASVVTWYLPCISLCPSSPPPVSAPSPTSGPRGFSSAVLHSHKFIWPLMASSSVTDIKFKLNLLSMSGRVFNGGTHTAGLKQTEGQGWFPVLY